MTLIVDRIEDGAFAVLATPWDRELVIPASWLPDEVSEGDVLRVEPIEPDGIRFVVDPEATRSRRGRIDELRDSIPRAPSGDLEL